MSFKACPNCHHEWRDRHTFLSDPVINIVGYQVNFGNLVAGFFLFTHDVPDCGTSMAVEAGQFKDMHDGPIFKKRLTETEKCPGYCLQENCLKPCPNECECAYVRDVIQKVKNWPKKPAPKS
jgi:hypothetical protein